MAKSLEFFQGSTHEKGVKWELRSTYFRLGKWDFIRWDWEIISQKITANQGMG
jgi:hypothetical protein